MRKPRRWENRKRWIGAPPAGEVRLMKARPRQCWNSGSSLLPKGIKSVTGISRGEVIRICNLQGRDIAHGVSRPAVMLCGG